MALAGELKAADPLARDRCGDRALCFGHALALKQLIADVALARLAQRLERRRVAARLRQAVPAEAQRVRARAEALLGERGVTRERERVPQVGADVLAHWERVDLMLADSVKHAARLLGALSRVLGEVAGDLAAGFRVQVAHIELVAPAQRAAAELVGEG